MFAIVFLVHIRFCSYYRVGLGVVQMVRYFKTSQSIRVLAPLNRYFKSELRWHVQNQHHKKTEADKVHNSITWVKVQILLVKYYSIQKYLLPKVFFLCQCTVLLLFYIIVAIPLKQLTIHYTYWIHWLADYLWGKKYI